ncbi:hypothetical protein ONS95_001501 [Cadophora gregata]|uniref:uncharacterized protein n=1 Tax=Cadophora gregata TaxID=51156 RepID=UPI0026DBE511|nr:uncharacterized protein ONS95_001501 [Cadophora gregata]KAK0111125.1 hypothetical protein ONS95_001501 [Cadophora gregata]
MKFFSTSTLLAAGLLQLASASDLRDESGDVWKNLLSGGGVEKRQSTWSPPANLVKPLQEVWDHEMKTYNNGKPMAFHNYGYDNIIAANGTINYCVRWDSKATLTAAQRQAIAASLQKNVLKWTDKLTGFMGWPYKTIPVKITGWATKTPSLLQGLSSSEKVHTMVDLEGIAECDPRCGRFYHTDGNYGSCPGGAQARYDMSLWLTAGMEGGAGGDWGQRVGSEYFLGALDNPHIWLHEFGHTLALDDFYDWTPTGITNFIMLAGSSMVVTDFDIWMMRDWWRNLASRYNLAAAPSPAKTTTKKAAAATPTKANVVAPAPTLKTTTTKKPALVATPAPAPAAGGAVAAKYAQCGGDGWKGATACVAGSKCVVNNQWYSQCI